MEKIVEQNVFDLFLDSASFHKHRLAVHDQEQRLTYFDLLQKVQGIAAQLSRHGVVAGDAVAVSVARDHNLLAVLLAIWSVGATYVPVDPNYPDKRKLYILQDCSAAAVIVDSVADLLEGVTALRIMLSQLLDDSKIRDEDLKPLGSTASRNLAYIIYTSGSTGQPKGVMVSHANVANFLLSMGREPGIGVDDRLLAVTTISFDIHVLELFLPLLYGASLYFSSAQELHSMQRLRELIDELQISFIQATPSFWRLLLTGPWVPDHPVKALIGGEALPADLIPLFEEKKCELWNMYGPTETTVWSLCNKIDYNAPKVYIGKPINNTDILIVDDSLNAVVGGSSGELLIGGKGVTSGYFNKPELTSEKFISISGNSKIWYRTGDLVRQGDGGNLEYLDRIDNLIKLRGHRIEPNEIEHAAERHPMVVQAVVVLAELSENDRRLVCFYTGEERVDAHESLLATIADTCPSYMLPQHIFWVKEFFYTDNLKIDRRQLSQLATQKLLTPSKGSFSKTRNPLEVSLMEIWAEILEIGKIGIEDDFFRMGGSSISAIRAVEQMNLIDGIDVSVADLFARPTIKSFLSGVQGKKEKDVVVINLNQARKGTPIFALCGVKVYQALVDRITDSGPCYGVFANEELAYLTSSREDVRKMVDTEKLVAAYQNAIRLECHRYEEIVLMGFSFGGVMALEVAKRLVKDGIRVQGVVLIDAFNRDSYLRSKRKVLSDIGSSAKQSGWLRTMVRGASRTKRYIIRRLSNSRPMAILRDQDSVFGDVSEHFQLSGEAYSGQVLLIKALKTDFGFGMVGKPDYGWGKRVEGDIEMVSFPLSHTQIMKLPGVEPVAQSVSSFMRMLS